MKNNLYMDKIGRKAKIASLNLSNISVKKRNSVLQQYSQYLKTRRKYVIVIMFAVAAILTPPDPITQIGLALPLLILYELSILTVKMIEKKKDA